MHPFRKLLVWQKAHELTVMIYRRSEGFQRRYPALASQLMRSAHSVPANIAEGSGRSTAKQFAYALQVSIGSARELDYFLQLAVDLQVISNRDHAMLEARVDEITRMLMGLRARLKPRARTP